MPRLHEMSVSLEICRMVEERIPAGAAGRVTRVGLVVGDDAGLEPGSLQFCLETLLGQPPFGEAVPEIRRQPGDALRLEFIDVEEAPPAGAAAAAGGGHASAHD